jgi:oxygen-independent coproporphyrinogen-3 oxidase
MKNGKIMPTDDDTIVAMYKYLIDKCKENHFEHYEISNFAKKGFRSRHNSAYWKRKSYLGIGPAAHSYDLIWRQWNVSNIKSYIQLLKSGKEYFEKEVLNEQDKYNDFVMVSLRTMDGVNLRQLEELFGKENLVNCLSEAKKHLENNLLALENDFLHLTTAGIMVSDSIIVDLMIV